MERAEKPVLIHCNWGADRSGLASALYLAAIAKEGEAKSESQISLWFGHIPIPLISKPYAMDQTFEALEPYLGFPKS
ncbi:protein tyrosine/serine phosphatase, partial [Rhizobium leguminosarum]|uniref:tyrosine-protein phosphatase n=1 Tax=Rhizobium leguminosarum TaxID=384 RepID=UPI0010317D03